MTKFNYSNQIFAKRNAGKTEEAITIALKARSTYPEENIFEKLLGDLYLRNKCYGSAETAYMNFLKKIGNQTQYIKHFAHFMQKYAESADPKLITAYCRKLEKYLDTGAIAKNAVPGICKILSAYMELDQMELFQDDRFFSEALHYLEKLENSCRLYILYYKILSLGHSKINKRIDKYIVSSIFHDKRSFPDGKRRRGPGIIYCLEYSADV